MAMKKATGSDCGGLHVLGRFLGARACPSNAGSYQNDESGTTARDRPASVHVVLVVLVFPVGAAALAHIAGDGDGAGFTLALVVAALGQLHVAGSFAPVALDACAGIAQFDFLEFGDTVVFFWIHCVFRAVRGQTVQKFPR